MASIYIGLNRGQIAQQGPDDITEGSSTGSTDVELRIDTGKSLTRYDIYLMVVSILNYIRDGRTSTLPL